MTDGRSNSDPGEATLLLGRVRQGEGAAAEELLPLVYEHLRAMAGAQFRGQRADHTLEPTALVHEAFLKLIKTEDALWQDEAHFCAVAARAMRQVLQDHARAKGASKRGGQARRVPLGDVTMPDGAGTIDGLALEEALAKLEAIDERQARIIELWFFGGLTVEQVAEVLGVSKPTVERAWRRSRAWLMHELSVERFEG